MGMGRGIYSSTMARPHSTLGFLTGFLFKMKKKRIKDNNSHYCRFFLFSNFVVVVFFFLFFLIKLGKIPSHTVTYATDAITKIESKLTLSTYSSTEAHLLFEDSFLTDCIASLLESCKWSPINV